MEPLGNDRWQRGVRCRRRRAAIATRSRPGSIPSSRGATSSSAASTPRTSASPRRSARSSSPQRGQRAPRRRPQRAARSGRSALRPARCRRGIDGDALKALALDDDAAPSWRGATPTAACETRLAPSCRSIVDRERARFSSWYELFPRSAGTRARRARHASPTSRRGCRYVAAMGFDVLYLPPIHPIGRDRAQGPNNALDAEPDDVGSPWAIGAAEGGHKAIHPELGTLEDFRAPASRAAARARHRDRARHRLPVRARPSRTCSEHPEWFRRRPDGSDPVRREPAEEVPGHLPVRLRERRLAARCGTSCKSVFEFWIGAGRARSSASTTRTPSRSRSGSG